MATPCGYFVILTLLIATPFFRQVSDPYYVTLRLAPASELAAANFRSPCESVLNIYILYILYILYIYIYVYLFI